MYIAKEVNRWQVFVYVLWKVVEVNGQRTSSRSATIIRIGMHYDCTSNDTIGSCSTSAKQIQMQLNFEFREEK
jgi:hypothetical protein